MSVWIAQHFLNPAWVLPGAALVASPIIIHLMSRVQYRRVRFAAMEFLLQSRRRNKRRLLLEQLLLLTLRVLAVLALVALISRLVLDPSQMSLFQGARAHHLVLLDDSASMQQRRAETTAFENAVDVVRRILSAGVERPGTQKFSLIRLSQPAVAVFTERDVDEAFLNEFDAKTENLACSHQSPELLDSLEAARRLFAQDPATIRHLHIVTDFRRRDWQDHRAIAGVLTDLDESGVRVNIVRAVRAAQPNLAITSLTRRTEVAAAGVPLQMEVGVANHSHAVATDVRLGVFADGNRLPFGVVFEKIEPETEVRQSFGLVFAARGLHEVHVTLDTDPLAPDNARYAAFALPAANPVLIIDGRPDGRAGRYVADALAADPKLTGFAPLVENVDYLRTQPVDGFRCIYLINVPVFPANTIESLEQFAAAGGGLVWFLGELVQPSFYNDTLYAGGNGGLFPVPLGLAAENLKRDGEPDGPDLVVTDHPVFSVFQGTDNPFIDSVRIDAFQPVAESWTDDDGAEHTWAADDNHRNDGVTTIGRLRTRDPLLLEHRFRETGGRILTCLTSADQQWNNWALNPSYVITQLEMQRHAARRDRSWADKQVGESIELDLPLTRYLETVEITGPVASGERITRLNAAPRDSGDNVESPRLSATFRDTDLPGVYKVRLLDADQIPEERWLAFNVSTKESDLRLANQIDLQARFGDAAIEIQQAGSLNWIQGHKAGRDVRIALLIMLFAILIAEQSLALRLSYHPPRAAAA